MSKQAGVVVDIDHVGSAHRDDELAVLLDVAATWRRPGQDALDLGDLSAIARPPRMPDTADFTAGAADMVARRPVRAFPRNAPARGKPSGEKDDHAGAEAFQQAHGITDLVVLADAGMLSAGNPNTIEDARFSFIVGSRNTKAPSDLAEHVEAHRDFFADG